MVCLNLHLTVFTDHKKNVNHCQADCLRAVQGYIVNYHLNPLLLQINPTPWHGTERYEQAAMLSFVYCYYIISKNIVMLKCHVILGQALHGDIIN